MSIECIIENGVATITLNRPDKFNSFNKEMALLLQQKLDAFAADDAVRAIVITGSGKAFCAGQDLAEAVSDDFPGFTQVVSHHYNPIIQKITAMPKPVIAAVNGVAAGAGANIALCCDIVVGSENASFIQAFSKIGLVPDSGGTYFLPKLIGYHRAMAYMMTGDKINAHDALQMGLLYKVFSAASFGDDVNAIAIQMAQMPTLALAYTKKLVQLSFDSDLHKQLEWECSFQEKSGNSDDYREGVAAFLEKRKAEFKGK